MVTEGEGTMKKLIYSAAIILSLTLAGCSDKESHSPQEILNGAMQETSELSSYYGEYTLTMNDGTEMLTKHWQRDGKVRIDMVDGNGEQSITVNDGGDLTTYTESTNTAQVFNLADDGMESFVQPTLREQALNLLEMVKDSHTLSVGEDEKIAGYDTYHLVATAKEPGSLMGDIEVWVDKKTWMTLKMVSGSGELQMTIEYTKFEPNAEINNDVFVLDLPEDAIIQEETVGEFQPLTMEQAVEKLGSFLAVPEETGYMVDLIEDMEMEETKEVAFSYVQNDEAQFSISIFKPLAPISEDEEQLEVRGQKGSKMEMDNFRFFQWDEEGLRYNVLIDNPDLSFEEVLAIVEKMEYVK